MKKLSIRQLTLLNRMTIEENGGQFIPPNNYLHGEQLEFLVDMVDAKLFGEQLYPEITDKAALYMFSVISNHIFSDGNKRTGLTAALTFLKVNGCHLRDELNLPDSLRVEISFTDYDTHLEAFTLAVAAGQLTLDECRAWFARNTVC